MDTKKTSITNEHRPFPRAVLIIFLVNFVTKFAQYVLRAVLPLYFVDKLKFEEIEATVTFHVIQVILYTSSLVGGLVADSFFGKYKAILYSNLLITLGLVVLSVALVPQLNLPVTEMTFLTLCAIHVGFGAMVPCIFSFGGDQFQLPQQDKQISLFFALILLSTNLGAILAFFISPILRKDVRCFAELGCYSLVFGIPACLSLVAIVTFFATKKLYTIHKPKDNVTVKITRCICHAFSRKLKSKEKNEHWLDYANDKYEAQFIDDIKSAFKIFTLYLPFIVFAVLYAAETTTMTFQASRMNGEVAGYLIKPDQIHIVQPLYAIAALPAFHYFVYPLVAKLFHMDSHLKKVIVGFSLAALSYYASSIVELNLETTYAPKPTVGNAHLRIYNTLDCKVIVSINEQKITIEELTMWENLTIAANGKETFKYSADIETCSSDRFPPKNTSGSFEVVEKQANSLVLTEDGLSYNFVDDNRKSQSGNPLVRALIRMDENATENNITLKIAMDEEVIVHVSIRENITKSNFSEVIHGKYDLYVDDQQTQSNVALKLGGVYTVLGYVQNSSKMTQIVQVTAPNSMHIFWTLPQLILFHTAVIIVEPLGTDFMYSQAPSSMKAFMQSYWVFLSAIGHSIVIVITDANFFDRKVFVFLLYAASMTIGIIIFALLAQAYKYPGSIAKDNSKGDGHATMENVERHRQ